MSTSGGVAGSYSLPPGYFTVMPVTTPLVSMAVASACVPPLPAGGGARVTRGGRVYPPPPAETVTESTLPSGFRVATAMAWLDTVGGAIVTVGTLVYPDPGETGVNPVMLPPGETIALKAAPLPPPPPVSMTNGGDEGL